MTTQQRSLVVLSGALLRQIFIAIVAAAIASGMASSASAEITLAYSFESGLEGFGPNGGGVTITEDAIGATEGTQSMKVDIVQGATFVGALTEILAPQIGDPPGLDVVLFDLTITEAFPGTFVDAGITIFCATQPDFSGGPMTGLQVQFLANQAPLGDLQPGTHEIRMDLTEAVHPITFVPGSFNDIFGVVGSGPNDMIPTGFQVYINKAGTAPWTGYIDNIRIGMSEGPADADFNDDGAVNGADLTIWKGAFGVGGAGDADGDLDSDGDDFLLWQRQVHAAAAAAVPEMSTFGLAAISLVAFVDRRSRPSARRRI